MTTRTFVHFKKIPKNTYFKYQGQQYFKNSDTTGVAQTQPMKHRALVEFNPTCPVQKED